MCLRLLLIVFVVLLVGFAPTPFPKPKKSDPSKDDLKKLQGEWVRTCSIIIADSRMTDTLAGKCQNTWAITLDASKMPKLLDIERKGATPPVTFVGIYRLKGDTLTLCSRWSKAEKDRPTDFDGSKPGVWLEVFRRRRP
jgi:uncharacterized protein (TIGR03067 family)